MQKKFLIEATLSLVMSGAICGCAPLLSGAMNSSLDENSIRDKTAQYFGVTSDKLTVFGVQKSSLSTTYQAKQAGKIYDCTIYYGEVKCVASAPTNVAGTPSINQQSTQVDATMSVQQAQTRLNQLGFHVGNPDGIFGKKSTEQLKLFQKSKGLPTTGKLDVRTIEALR